MTKDELIAALSEYGVNVEAGQQALTELEGYVSLSNVLGDDVVASPEVLSSTIVDLTNSLQERETRLQELTAKVQEVELSAATTEVETLISKGRILPAWKDDMIELSMTDRSRFETFLLPEEMANAELSEVGYIATESPLEEDPATRARAEGERIAKLAQ